MPQVVFVLNKDTGLLEAADSVSCDLCKGKVVDGNERHRRRRQLAYSKNWTRLRPMCAKCDGHGYVLQSGNYWRRMYKKAEDSFKVGELPGTQSVAGSSKAMLVAKEAFENYEEPKELAAFLTKTMRRKNIKYAEVLDQVTKALICRALKVYPTNVSGAASLIGMNRTTFTKLLKEMKDDS